MFAASDEVAALRLERPFPPESLTRVSPAVLRPGIHLGIHRQSDELWVWGATRNLPPYSFVLEVIAPGLLVVKHSRAEDAFVRRVAVLEGDRIKVIDESAAKSLTVLPCCTSSAGIAILRTSPSALIQLAVSMREHRRGGLLLVVPSNGQQWQESTLRPITYPSSRPSPLAELAQTDLPGVPNSRRQRAAAVDGVAGLTAVDATIITERYELLRLRRQDRTPSGLGPGGPRDRDGADRRRSAETVEPPQLGGTRHLGRAVRARPKGRIAPGRFADGTSVRWSPCDEMVPRAPHKASCFDQAVTLARGGSARFCVAFGASRADKPIRVTK